MKHEIRTRSSPSPPSPTSTRRPIEGRAATRPRYPAGGSRREQPRRGYCAAVRFSVALLLRVAPLLARTHTARRSALPRVRRTRSSHAPHIRARGREIDRVSTQRSCAKTTLIDILARGVVHPRQHPLIVTRTRACFLVAERSQRAVPVLVVRKIAFLRTRREKSGLPRRRLLDVIGEDRRLTR